MERSLTVSMRKILWDYRVVRLYLLGYFCLAITGWLLLQLPVCQNQIVSGIDLLFTTASAVSTTGLATIDIAKSFTFQGQWIVLLLMQLGGIGYMIFSSFIILSLEQKIADSAPSALKMAKLFKQVIGYTVFCEVIGTAVLYFLFQNEKIESTFWNALFHTVSAFCTAGFSLFSTNLENFHNHLGINLTLSILSIMGAFGFFWGIDCFKRILGQKESHGFLSRGAWSFAAFGILLSTLLFLLMGDQSIVIAFFHATSALTTVGFNTINMKILPFSALLFLVLLMLSGASLTSRNRKLKGTSFVSLLEQLLNLLTGGIKDYRRGLVALFQRTRMVTSIFLQFLLVLIISCLALQLIDEQPFFPLLFEAASALCTVGLSMGITSLLTVPGKSLIILLMFIGRMSILIYGFLLSVQIRERDKII